MSDVAQRNKKENVSHGVLFSFLAWLRLFLFHIPGFDPQRFGTSFESQLFFEAVSEIGEMRRAVEYGDL